MRQEKIEALHERTVEHHKSCFKALDPLEDNTLYDDFARKSYSYGLCDTKVEEFKKFIEDNDGKKMWESFSYLKSELANNWINYSCIQSGRDIDDAVEREIIRVWACRSNKHVNKTKRKA